MGPLKESGNVFFADGALRVLRCFLNHSSCFSYGMLCTYVMWKPQKATLSNQPLREKEKRETNSKTAKTLNSKP
jgi:hypothetical protein